jgi:hypothetical protein
VLKASAEVLMLLALLLSTSRSHAADECDVVCEQIDSVEEACEAALGDGHELCEELGDIDDDCVGSADDEDDEDVSDEDEDDHDDVCVDEDEDEDQCDEACDDLDDADDACDELLGEDHALCESIDALVTSGCDEDEDDNRARDVDDGEEDDDEEDPGADKTTLQSAACNQTNSRPSLLLPIALGLAALFRHLTYRRPQVGGGD